MEIRILVPNKAEYIKILDVLHPDSFVALELDADFLHVDFLDLNSVEIYAKYHFQITNG